jgi:hypothetical protein
MIFRAVRNAVLERCSVGWSHSVYREVDDLCALGVARQLTFVHYQLLGPKAVINEVNR